MAHVPAALTALYAAPLLLAMAWDAASLRIPDRLTGGMALAFLVVAALAPGPVDWASHLGAGALAFAVAAAAFAAGALGGGDVKLIGATALWLGFGPLADFVLLTALFGGALSLVLLLARRLPPGGVVPYGLAIGAAGLALAGRLPLAGPG